jgi:hypothetical protein
MLQGWRGSDLEQARRNNPVAHRLAPAACAVLASGVIITGSTVLLVATMPTAAYGAVGSNHPIELAYNAIAAALRCRCSRPRARTGPKQ